ncbi:pentapeptide repeat-containing protein [Candidatus Protochlamydia amoebophila]|uniref:F-box domain-containing protein n=1 Tax=Protochlamydia amoebophila (strain UWE25) TaxID=264201 RepID=Q6MD92_PARUW|nr:pentapeptide repeat-containing protein [Candidatus Protochlamydia amoebophila]CAF23457.1 unnamed protein product [Candidatus Protochlamydia amoebophila UWE25]
MLLPSNIDSNINSKIFVDSEQNPLFPSPLATKIGLKIFKYLESLDREQAKLVCRKWKQLIDKIHIIERYNTKLMNAAEVRQEATHYLRNSKKLKAEQRFLLTIVRLSKDCIKIKVAAANALMILKKTNFSFVGSDFRGIQAPGVRLARTILDKVNFLGANLEEADFTDCSLEDAILDGAELKDVQFGQLPYLNHQSNVLAMAVSPNGNLLASVDQNNFYVWNLETFEVEKQPLEIKSPQTFPQFLPLETENTQQTFLQFFQNGQFFFKASSKKEGKAPQKARIEIWKTTPLEMSNSLVIDDIDSFSLLALSQDGKTLITVTTKKVKGFYGELYFDKKTEIRLWQIDFNDQNLPQIIPVKTKTITGSAQECSYAPKTSIIAIIIAFNASFPNSLKLYTLPNLEIKQEWALKSLEEKRKFLNSMIFTPQENQLIINIVTKTDKIKSKVYSWNIKNKQKKKLFSEEHPIKDPQFLPDSSRIAYFVAKGHETFFCIRNKDFKLNFSERFSNFSYRYRIIAQSFISNGQFIFRPKINQISITLLKTFVGKKELPLSIRDMYFSPDEQTIFLWNYNSDVRGSPINNFFSNTENKLYTYQTLNGKRLGYKKLPTSFSELTWGRGCQLSFDAQYCIRKYFPESNGKNKITISEVENEKVQASYAGSFLDYFLSKDNRYIVFIYQNQLKLIKIDFKKHDQLVNVDTTEQNLIVLSLFLLSKEKVVYTFSDPLFPITTLALRSVETGNISLWEINWETQQLQGLFLWSTELPSPNFCVLGIPKLCFQKSKFYFQKNNRTLAIWNKETFSEENIKLKNELIDFLVSQDGLWMMTIEKLVSSMHDSVLSEGKSKFRLWNLEQMKKLDHFTLPFGRSMIRLSTRGNFLIVNHSTSDFAELSIRKVKKGKFHLLWKTSQYLNVKGLSLKNTQNLDAKNTLLLTQLQNKKVLDENI